MQEYFNQECVWNHSTWSEHEEKRLQRTLGLVPKDAVTILDVGCGDGVLINRLVAGRFCVGVDFSTTALKQVNVLKALSVASCLPFKDASFDCVICTGVLEHLDTKDHKKAIAELNRVSARYIMIGVPYNENLRKCLCKCPVCGYKFNGYTHKRSYTEISLNKLFKDLQLSVVDFFDWRANYENTALLKFKQDFCGDYPYYSKAVCPQCGFNFSSGQQPNIPLINKLVAKLSSAANLTIAKILKTAGSKSPVSIILLYTKTKSSNTK